MDKPIYALSGYAEWFWLMAKNWKDVENRGWSLFRYIKPDKLPIRIYLHASKKPTSRDENNFIYSMLTDEQWAVFSRVKWDGLRGHIIGEITITGQTQFEMCSKWFFGEFGFTVQDGILYDKPIPCRGQLGFFRPEIKEANQ